ncbi:MAG TPA: beta-N-acetylhexosaminidase [Steroidobacteraceae bacterium]|nr:beta-N-acetylhexosaminidase [Steroidobacteraceae bacterium]
MSLGPLMVDLSGLELSAEDRELLSDPRVGSVILFSRNYADPAQLEHLVSDIHAVRDPPLIVSVDHEGGRVQRFRRAFTVLPAARLIGRQYDMDQRTGLELARSCAWLMGAELRAVGVDLTFAPVVDLDYAVSEVIGDRAYHRDPDSVAALANACMAGLRDAGMGAVAKHFPGHGAVVADSHFALPVDRRSLADLEPELTPYRRLIANGLTGIMAAHVAFPEVDPLPASLSARWITDILRRELQFHGVIFADDLSMGGAAAAGTIVERARLALAAGCDVLPVCNNRPAVHEVLSGLGEAIDPARQIRLVRLHGKRAPGRRELTASARWRDVSAQLKRSFEPPALSLDSENA